MPQVPSRQGRVLFIGALGIMKEDDDQCDHMARRMHLDAFQGDI